MAYLHCHSCDWSQDDFWSWNWSGVKKFWKWSYRPFGYNPFSLLLEDIAFYAKPKIVKMDSWWAEENGFKTANIHSWRMLVRSVKLRFKGIANMKWWTWESWKKSKDNATCPGCGAQNFDID